MATQTFLDEARRLDSAMVALVKVYLTSPTTRTLYLGPSDLETPNFDNWEPVITDYDPIKAPSDVLGPGPDLCTAGFTLAARATLGWQASTTKNLTNLFSEFRWIGAKVEIYMWPFRLTSFSDAQLAFTGIVASYQVGPDKIEVGCTQRNDWNRPVSPTVVARDLHPRAPDRSVGLPKPIIYGKVGTPPLRQPTWPSEYDLALHDMEHIGGGPVGIPAVCIDTGRGGSSRARYLISGHQVASHNTPSRATTYYLRESGLLAPVEPSTFTVPSCSGTAFDATLTTTDDFYARGVRVGMPISGTNVPAGAVVASFNSATSLEMSVGAGGSAPTGTMTFVATFNDVDGAGFELADQFKGGSYPVPPADVSTSITSPADDLRYAMDVFNEITFAKFACQTSGIDKRRGRWRLPDIATPGDFEGRAYIRILYKSSAALTNFRVGLPIGGGTSYATGTVAASTTATRASFLLGVSGDDWGVVLPGGAWALSDAELIAEWEFTPASRQDFWLYAIGLEVVYAPKARVYTASQVLRPRRLRRKGDTDAVGLFVPETLSTPDTEIEADFFGSVEGLPDPSSFTAGGAGTLIELPPDIGNHLLQTYGGQTSGQVQTSASTFGSFVDGRAGLKTWRGTDWKCALQIAEKTDLGAVLEAVAKGSLSQVYLDRFTDKWHWVPWRKGSGTDYARGVYRDDLIDFHCESIQANRVPSGVKVSYAWDGNTRRFLNSTFCGLAGSQAGHRFMDIRDEDLAVLNDINDKVPFAVSGFSGAADIATGAKADLHTLAAAVDTALEAAAVSHDFMVAHSNRIVTGYNDKIDFNDGAAKTATLTAGTYATMELLATMVAAAMNFVSSSWSCTYVRATRKVTIDRSSGTKNLLCSTGANKATTAFANLGYTSVADVTGGTAGSFEVEEDRLIIECLTSAMDLLWASGTNGTATTTPKAAAELCGFVGTYDRDAAGTRRWWVSDSPKGAREQTLAAGAAVYGYTRELTIDAKAIYDTDSARELRNRLVDWLKEPRVIVRFVTSRMPDIRRGELVKFDDLDEFGVAFPKQGSDGLWTGKRFRVLTVWQYLGDKFDQEIECIEND